MRATLRVLVALLGVQAFATRAFAAPPSTVGVYWQPPGSPAPGARAREAFAAAVARLGGRLVDAPARAPAPLALEAPLETAKAAYTHFAFPEALAKLDDVQRLADASGGGGLATRQLSEIFLYRGLARLETAGAEAAWDDLVRAARLDPGRVMDPAQFPPRAFAAFKRAAAEAAASARAELTIVAPPRADVHIDGQDAKGATSVPLGPHFVVVVAEGYEPWAGVVTVASAKEAFSAPLRAYQPPTGDELLALAGTPAPERLLLGALVTAGGAAGGWRFVVSAVTLPEGRAVSDAVTLGDVPTGAAITGLVEKIAPAPVADKGSRRWLPWVLAGAGVAAALSVATTLFLTRDTSSPNVVGHLGTWQQ